MPCQNDTKVSAIKPESQSLTLLCMCPCTLLINVTLECGHNKMELFSLIKLCQDRKAISYPMEITSAKLLSLSMVLFKLSLGKRKSRAVSVIDFKKLDNKGVKGHGEFGVQTKFLCKMVKMQLITRKKKKNTDSGSYYKSSAGAQI